MEKVKKTNQADKTKRENHNNFIKLSRVIALVVAAGILLAASFLIPSKKLQNGEQNIKYYPAKVVEVLQDNTQKDTTTEGVRRGSQVITIEITKGPYKDQTQTIENYLSTLFNVYVKEGSKIIVRATVYEDGTNFSVYNYDRSYFIYGFVGLFALSLCLIGGRKGLMSFISLGLTLIMVIKILLPLLLLGYPAVTVTIGLIIFATIIGFILLDGVNVKTISATIGTITGVGLAGLLTLFAGIVGHITGFQMEEAENLVLIASQEGLKVKNLLICGILIASLGAVMDIAMSIASSIHELKEANPRQSTKELFRSGMNIGKDAMGTMTNTLILAFTGSSLNLLLMMYSYGIPYSQLINTDIIAIEIIRGIAGSIGIILTVPIVAWLSSVLENKKAF
ncbi:YibE/F family protein [Anaerocolumna xylanovorans]|uniref:Uncharacterized membrane protein n=1 Tax=Anaerocolumna xylanovorans DSM 12503 TaxID=1121345 RepID=A0A1M7Y0Y6_9FIRM|nr:YibE/F family protein [Anaerocolumna xylanovorans]SHO45195.1 Uncharacterized membrane protein [Anaerocolumna xylanovorans DSM 12503]